MLNQIKDQIPQPILNRIIEIDEKLENVLFNEKEISYLDQVKVQNLQNQIQKIYLKYCSKEFQANINELQKKIDLLLEEDELDIQAYSILDRKLKEELKAIKKPTMMTTLDHVRVESFQERIDDIYAKYTPKHNQFINAEKLMKERESLLELL